MSSDDEATTPLAYPFCAELDRQPPGHHLEHLRHAALACRLQVSTILVRQSGNQTVTRALTRLLGEELVEPAEGGEVVRPVRRVVRPLRRLDPPVVELAAVGVTGWPVPGRWLGATFRVKILCGHGIASPIQLNPADGNGPRTGIW